jgi:hypothetical protein
MTLLSKSIASTGKTTFGLLRQWSPAFVVGSGTAGGETAFFSSTSHSKESSSVDASGFDTVGCVGLGLMGHGICQVAATSGVHSKVIAFEQEQRFLDSGYVSFHASLQYQKTASPRDHRLFHPRKMD